MGTLKHGPCMTVRGDGRCTLHESCLADTAIDDLREVYTLAVDFARGYDGPGRTKESRALLAKVRSMSK